MANEKSSIILNNGLNAIHASPFGSYFALKYWLPIYDPRIDDDIHESTQAATDGTGVNVYPLSATLDANFTHANLEGEKLFNADSSEYQSYLGVAQASDVYYLPSDRDYVISATNPTSASVANGYSGLVTSTSASITNTSQSRGVIANLINGGTSAISTVLSATTLSADGSGDFSGTGIGVMPKIDEMQFALAGGVNTSAVGLLYDVASFTSVNVSGDNLDAGRYAIRLTSQHGNFRFNKFVLYAVRVDVNGNVDSSVLPVPFSVSVFEGTHKKMTTNDDGTGFSWEGVIQLVFQRDPTLGNLTNLIIDNWTDLSLSEFTLATNKRVHIFDADSYSHGHAKLTVTDNSRPQLDLSFVDTGGTSAHSYLATCADGHLDVSASNVNLTLSDLTLSFGSGLSSTGLVSLGNYLVMKGSESSVGMNILCPDSGGFSEIVFGNESDNNIAKLTMSSNTSALNCIMDSNIVFSLESDLVTIPQSMNVSGTTIFGNNMLISTGTGLSQTANTGADELTLKGSSSSIGMSILCPDSGGFAELMFGNESDNNIAKWTMISNTSAFNCIMDSTTVLSLAPSSATFNTRTIISTGTGLSQEANTGADDLVIRGSDSSIGMSILCPDSGGFAELMFGNESDNNIVKWTMVSNTSALNCITDSGVAFTVKDNGVSALELSATNIYDSGGEKAMELLYTGNEIYKTLSVASNEGGVFLNVGSISTPKIKLYPDNTNTYIEIREANFVGTPTTPSSTYGKIFTSADGNLYFINDSGTISQLN